MQLPRMAILLMTLCACSEAAAAQTPQAAATQPSVEAAPQDPWASIAPSYTPQEDQILKRGKRPSKSAATADGASQPSGSTSWRTFVALAGVVCLILFLGWGYRAMAGGNLALLGKHRRPGVIEIVSKTSLTAKQSLCLVRVGPRMVLIGQSPDALRTLDVIADPDVVARLAGDAARKQPSSSDAEFQECLEREAREYPRPANEEMQETYTPEARRIDDVRQSLADTIRKLRGTANPA